MTRREIRALDRFVSHQVRLRGACERCGSIRHLQTSHIYSRSYYAVRFWPANVRCLCARCHWMMTKNPIEHAQFAWKVLGNDELIALQQRRYFPPKRLTVATVKGWWT